MLFSSLEFLYLFLPLTATAYFLCRDNRKNHVLLVASLIFYGIAEPKYLPLMLAVAMTNFALGLAADHAVKLKKLRSANATVAMTVIINALCLFVFKYLDAMLELFGADALGIDLPIGISFYIFQAMSYVFDVRRGTVTAQKNPLRFITYVVLFPQLVAGPIVRYCDIQDALDSRKHSVAYFADGIRLFCIGLSKKMLLANGAGESWERLAGYSKTYPTVLGAWLGIIFFAFQIYFDFSGYSDMARGLGKMFGFDFPENFRYPYTSKSITEFWRRWHITLSTWFREYVYISLGGNRRSKARTYFNLLITWLLTGAWHGASINFLIWGLYFFVLLVLEKSFFGKLLKRLPSFLSHAYALFFILIGWLIFASDGAILSAAEGASYLGQMFGIGASSVSNDSLFELLRSLPFLAIMCAASTPLPNLLLFRLRAKRTHTADALCVFLAIASLTVCTCYLADSGYNPFLYFKF